MWVILTSIFPYVIAYTVPLLVASLGGLYSERSGVTNLGLEGLMLVGSFSAAVTINLIQGAVPQGLLIPIGFFVAAAVGILCSLLHAFASITLKADQIISGTAINMLAAALTVYIARSILGSGNVRVSGIIRKDIPFLSRIPILGPLFFFAIVLEHLAYSDNSFVFVVFAVQNLVRVTAESLRRTPLGSCKCRYKCA